MGNQLFAVTLGMADLGNTSAGPGLLLNRQIHAT